MPVLRNAVTTEFVHGEAIKKAGGKPLTTSFWFPDAAFDGGGVGLFSTIEHVEEIEISLPDVANNPANVCSRGCVAVMSKA